MRVRQLEIDNFRGITKGRIVFQPHTLLVGGNNIGKSTVCEALELVLGPERLRRYPIINEHDFSHGTYLGSEDKPCEIRIRVVLNDLSDEQQRRFFQHLRRWNDEKLSFVDEKADSLQNADDKRVVWALPVIFIGRYDQDEDDFIGGTFFEHPLRESDDLGEEMRSTLGSGLTVFSRAHKRLCGFIFLRDLRTGTRALSLHRGSLLDTILRLGGEGTADMWRETLEALQGLDPAIGEIEQLRVIREKMRERLGKFVHLARGEESMSFFASDLTRENLREVVQLFIATKPSNYAVPFTKQGAGSINLLVFTLLTIIADRKEGQSVIFVMEEPEIALPPHIQRRITKYVLQRMGQSIVTSHSPYVIEQFYPENVVILARDGNTFSGKPIDTKIVKAKTYRTQRRQFAEAILSRAVFVLEGQTEMVAVQAVSSALERFRDDYSHVDLAGVTLFNAGNDREVSKYAPIFKALGKKVYGMRDKFNAPEKGGALVEEKSFEELWVSPEKGIEKILVNQVPVHVLRSFLEEVVQRDDYPNNYKYEAGKVSDDELADLALEVLKARKGDAYGFGYTGILIDQCQSEDELPAFIRDALLSINEQLNDEIELEE
ncbi:ATP-binding protein [Gleimia sp. 6138-11-ORH1]|uniref:ATP-dependent nuclease n=1 Tax=Gleimia sp. 6138-11-ORH1 TaxID=2973937 RepID=UPI002169DE5E|nr:ATP-binding protein [Gleimia sp. 6138-11-ORH1]MCS4484015.1 ATP-binding protein [Gleimia sp. 6138-11-ORH1]